MKHALFTAIAASAALAVGCLAATVATPASAQSGPSFDCGKAHHPVEQMICQDPDLSLLDREIAALYEAAGSGSDMTSDRRAELTARQRSWIDGRNGCGGAPETTACVTAIYGQRILELKTHYRGATGDAGIVSFGPVNYGCDAPVHGLDAVFINGPVTRWAVVSWDDNAVMLPETLAVSGTHYAPGLFGDPFDFWMSHDEATFTIPGQPAVNCIQVQG